MMIMRDQERKERGSRGKLVEEVKLVYMYMHMHISMRIDSSRREICVIVHVYINEMNNHHVCVCVK